MFLGETVDFSTARVFAVPPRFESMRCRPKVPLPGGYVQSGPMASEVTACRWTAWGSA